MVQLYINNQQVIVDENIYFPFTKKVFDIENPTLINFECSKTITIKRCVENDDIFGNITEITRVTYGFEDNKSNILYNQLKKIKYELYNDSEFISSGIVKITNITETEYELELYDDIINVIENFDETKLSDLDIYENNGTTIFSKPCNLYYIYEQNPPIVPVFGIEDYDFDKKKIVCRVRDENNESWNFQKTDLPSELTQIQARTFKSYSHSYALPINKIFESINKKYGEVIEVDNSVYDLLGDLHIKLNKPKVNYFENENIITLGGNDYSLLKPSGYGYFDFDYKKSDNINLEYINQKVVIKTTFDIQLKPHIGSYNPYNVMTSEPLNEVTSTYHYFTDKNNSYMGKLYFISKIIYYYNDDIVFESEENISKISLLQNENIFGDSDNKIIKIKETILNTFEISTNTSSYFNRVDIKYNITNFYDKTLPKNKSNMSLTFFNNLLPSYIDVKTNSVKHEIISKNLEKFQSNDIINGKNLYPKVFIKDFLINFVKGFNLDIFYSNGKIKISEKKFIETDEPLIITDIKSIKNSFDFSEFNFKTELPKSVDLDNYKTKYNKTYGEQVINTGLTIKKNKKEIKLPFSIPFLKIDSNYFAYDNYGGYFNAGYSRVPFSVFPDDDVLCFSYLNQIKNEKIFITDDRREEHFDDKEFGMTLPALYYNPNEREEFKWRIPKDYQYYDVYERTINNWFTLSPYLFDNDGKIIKSLEMNKPLYSYANITDSQYNVDTTLYDNYFKNLFSTIYDVDAHEISCKLLIEDKLSLNKIYNYKNSNYIISEIIEYNPLVPGLYDVKLLKVKDKMKLINIYNKKNYIEITSHLPIVNNYNSPTFLYVSGKIYNLNNKTISNVKLVTSLTNNNPTIGGNNCVSVTGNIFGNNYDVWNYNLSTNSSYYYRTIVTYSDNTYDLSTVQSVYFGGGITPPSWTTSVEQIDNETLRFNLTDMDDKGTVINNVEVFGAYYTTPSETMFDIYQNSYENKKNYIFTFSGLSAVDSPIYYMIKVTNDTGLVNYIYGEKPMTVFVDPSIGGILTTNRTQTSLSGVFSFNLGTTDYVYELSVMIGTTNGTNKNVYLQKLPIVPNNGLKEFTFNGLLPSVTYYIIAYVQYNGNVGVEELYNNLHTTNTTYLPPTITCSAVSKELLTNVDVHTNYQIDIPSRISRRGICYSQIVSTPTISDTTQYDTTKSNGSKMWTFSSSIPSKSKYRIRGYIQTTDGYIYYSPVSTISIIKGHPLPIEDY